jgi:hypothetical protein
VCRPPIHLFSPVPSVAVETPEVASRRSSRRPTHYFIVCTPTGRRWRASHSDCINSAGLCKLCGGTRHAGSSLWVSDRIDSNHCGITADLSENRRARIPKICKATVLEKSIVWTFTHGAISNDGRQIESISSVTDLHSRTRIDNRAKFVARCGPYGNGFC